jgi:hypothetical protein
MDGRRTYVAPRLREFGSFAELTKAGNASFGESAGGLTLPEIQRKAFP